MKAVFVQSTQSNDYARCIVKGYKMIETRSKDVLKSLVGERVAVIRTSPNGGNPKVVGYVTIRGKRFCPADEFRYHYWEHLVPQGSKFDCTGKGKWFYYLEDPEALYFPYTPQYCGNHGRSWAIIE